jgi:predicted transcriptional regulator
MFVGFHKEVVMQVKDVMHKNVTWVSPATSISEIANRMRDEDIGAIPVGENDRLIGMVTDRDLACRGLTDGHDVGKLTARDVMSKPIFYCHSDDQLQKAAEIMESKNIRRLPVINEQKRMVGMISLGDLASKASRRLSAQVLSAVSAHHP